MPLNIIDDGSPVFTYTGTGESSDPYNFNMYQPQSLGGYNLIFQATQAGRIEISSAGLAGGSIAIWRGNPSVVGSNTVYESLNSFWSFTGSFDLIQNQQCWIVFNPVLSGDYASLNVSFVPYDTECFFGWQDFSNCSINTGYGQTQYVISASNGTYITGAFSIYVYGALSNIPYTIALINPQTNQPDSFGIKSGDILTISGGLPNCGGTKNIDGSYYVNSVGPIAGTLLIGLNLSCATNQPNPTPISLKVLDQPAVYQSGSLLSQQPSVGIVDGQNNFLTGYNTDVQATLIVLSGSATLTGTTTVSTVNGVAYFTDLVITGNGLFYIQFDSLILSINSTNSNEIFFPPDAGNPNPPIPVKPKRSYISGSVPAYTDLEINEFAINVADRKGYIRDSNDIVHLLFDGYASSGGGTGGTVYSVGVSSTDLDVTNSPVTTSGFIGLDLATQSITAGTYGDGSNTVSITVNSKGIITGISENALATSNWNTAYGWGDHSLAGYLTSETDPVYSASTAAGITSTDTGNWNTAYGWGDHSTAGYLTTETDPTFTASAAYSITSTDTTNWNTAYGWGDHSKAGYLTSVTTTNVSEGTNLYFTDARARAAVSAGTGISYDNTTGVITNSDPDQLVTLTAGTDISITGTYPSFTINYSGSGGSGSVTSVAVSVPTGLTVTSGSPVTTSGTIAIGYDTGYSIPLTADQTNWNTAYGWGNHASAGYLTSETDPVFVASTAYGITTTDTGNWGTAYTERHQWDGGSTNLVAATGRSSLGGTTVGSNLFTLTNPSAVTFLKINANNTITTESASTFRTSIGAGTGNGTVTSIATTSPITGGTITSTGTIGINASSTNTASYVVQRDASGNFSAGTITASLTGTASTATNVAGGSGGTIHYQSAANTTAMLANGTANQILQANGGTSAPSWVSTLTGVTITGLKETKTAPSISSGTLTLDCSVGNVFAVSLNANITTLSFTNVPATGTAFGLTLMLTADGTARTITWGSSVKWAGGTAPTLTSTNGKVDVFVLLTHDGSSWYAFTSGQNL